MKRLVLILGGKGGTGKTAFARLLLDQLHALNKNYLAYDADTENPELYDYYKGFGKGVEKLDFLEVSGAKKLLTDAKLKSPDAILIDMPGASGYQTREIIKKFGLFKLAETLGYRVTVVTVINLGYAVINSLKVMSEFCENKVDYVVAKNLAWDKGLGFKRWEKSETRKSVIDNYKGIEIEFPELDYGTFDELLEKGLPFSKASEENGFPLGDYFLVDAFLDQARPELEKAGDYLGLSIKFDSQPEKNSAPEPNQLTSTSSRKRTTKTSKQ